MLELTTARPLHPLARVAGVAAVAAAWVALLVGVMRPWYVRWGATDAEVTAVLPGDELWPEAAFQETRAVHVSAPPAAVWPWVSQLGQDKGGFYSYELLENLVGGRMRNADRLLGLPDPGPGERLWMAPPDAAGGGHAVHARVEPPDVLAVLVHGAADDAPTGSWSFVLRPEQEGTRLLVRTRGGRKGGEGWLRQAWREATFAPIHFVMERRMMLGIAERAEGRPPAKLALVVEPLAWLAMLGVALVAAGTSLWRGRPGRALRLLAGAGAALAVLPLTEPPLVVTVAAAGLLVSAVPWALGRRASPRRLPL